MVGGANVALPGVMANGSHDGTEHCPRSFTPSPKATRSFLTTLDQIRSTLSRTSHDETLLRDDAWPTILKRISAALDTGKPITGAGPNRGLPMDVVVQTLKAAWHVDGTWPIGPNALDQLEQQSRERAEWDKGPQAKQDPTPDQVAIAYKARGIQVEEPHQRVQDDW